MITCKGMRCCIVPTGYTGKQTHMFLSGMLDGSAQLQTLMMPVLLGLLTTRLPPVSPYWC